MKSIKGSVYWCIEPDLESQNHGDDKPRKPWQGKVWHVKDDGCFFISRLHDDGSVDIDSNSTAVVDDNKVYNSYEEAKAAYVEKMMIYIRERAMTIINDINELIEL